MRKRDVIELAIIWGLAIIVGTALIIAFNIYTRPVHGQQFSCPSGSYEIDQGVCKKEPTGCPYGDSIPLGPDCDKHIPVEAQVKSEQIELSPTVENFVGK